MLKSHERLCRIHLFPFVVLGLTLTSRPAFAYIDPGTSQAIWTSLAPLVGVLLACAGISRDADEHHTGVDHFMSSRIRKRGQNHEYPKENGTWPKGSRFA